MSFKHSQVPPKSILYFIHILASSKERCVFIVLWYPSYYYVIQGFRFTTQIMQGHAINLLSVSHAKKYKILYLNWCHFFSLCLLESQSQNDDKDIQNCLPESRLCSNMEKVNQLAYKLLSQMLHACIHMSKELGTPILQYVQMILAYAKI